MRELEFEFINNWKSQSKEIIYFDLFSFTINKKSWLNSTGNLTISFLNFDFKVWYK